MRTVHVFRVAAIGIVAAVCAAPLTQAQDRERYDEQPYGWVSAGNGLTDAHEAPHERWLSPATVPSLHTRWVFTADGEVQGTPTVAGSSVYFNDAGGSVWKVDAQNGAVIWKTSLPAITGLSGSYSRVSPALARGLAIIGDQASGTLIALSQETGNVVWTTVLSNYQGAIITSSPVIAGNRIFVGVSSNQEGLAATQAGFVLDFRGSVAAVDLSTGKLIWQTDTVPQGYTGGAVWNSNIAVDLKRSAIFLGTGNNYSVPPAVAACQAAASTPIQMDACLAPGDHIDSIMSLDMNTGAIRWSQRMTHADTWTVSCLPSGQPPATPCPTPTGLDTDFGSAPNLFTILRNGQRIDAVGEGQKSGAYYALNRDTGAVIWGTQVSPDGTRGGIEWGTATDGRRIYIPNANSLYVPTTLVSGVKTLGGYWAALDVSTGQILWETPTFAPAPPPASPRAKQPPPGANAEAEGSVSVAGGVLFGEDAAGNDVALDGATGKILWTYQSGGAGVAAPSIVKGALYWPSGYKAIGPTNNKVYSFAVSRTEGGDRQEGQGEGNGGNQGRNNGGDQADPR